MSETVETPTLHFFRARPENLTDHPPLASSLQSLETTFFLLALKRYPAALVSCASAWESAIKAKLAIVPSDRVTLAALLETIRDAFPILNEHGQTNIKVFREARNRIVHYGFSPKDDRVCAGHLVETGLPFLCALYRELFDFYVNWHEIQPECSDFMQLTDSERAKAGLFPEIADQLCIVDRMHKLNLNRADFDHRFCFTAFSHYVRVRMKEAFKSYSEGMVDEQADANGMIFDLKEAEKGRIERGIGGETWDFDCPICDGVESVVAWLDTDALEKKQPSLTHCVCVSCQLFIPKEAYHLADLVLDNELRERSTEILENYGLQ